MQENLFKKLEEFYPEMVNIRRDLHMYPELSFQEVNTPKKIADFLRNLDIEVKTHVGGRGVVGILKGKEPGKTIALRADFDALPIQEENNVPYKSKIPGVMHACGHDIHTATLLGVAKVLSTARDNLKGTVVLIHQFAEELLPGGAKLMIEDNCLDGVDYVYGAHVFSFEPFGTVGFREGAMLSAADSFSIEIQGKGGHGSQPHKTVDPVITACQLVINLQLIASRRIDPQQPVVISVGAIESGNAFNVIPDTATIKGSVRSADPDVRNLIEKEIRKITKHSCESAGAEVEINYERGYPAVVNSPEETERVEKLAKQIIGEENVLQREFGMGSEDFAYYLEKVPGTFFSVGGGNPDIGATYPNHHPQFNVDERSMLIAGKIFIATVLNQLYKEEIEGGNKLSQSGYMIK